VPPGPFVPNRAATTRATRLFWLFVAATDVVVVVLLVLLATSPEAAVRDDALYYTIFGIIGLALVGASYALTLLPTPKGIARAGREIVLTERTGRVRRLGADRASLRPVLLARYEAGPLNERAVLLVEVALPSGRRRSYLLEEGLIDLPDRRF
jgi:hypothetical protein